VGLAWHAWGDVCAGRAPSACLIVTSCWVFSGWVMVAVDSGGTVVLVSQDGIQRPPFRFPKGGHLLQFLSCLENGLLPHGQLDPPLWSQRGKGKVFPKLRKRSPQGSAESTSSDKEDDEATDYVFRIIYPGMQSEFVPQDLMDVSVSNLPPLWQPSPRKSSCSSCSQSGLADGGSSNGCNHERAPLKLLCDNMKYQILSRAFYGCAYRPHLPLWSTGAFLQCLLHGICIGGRSLALSREPQLRCV